LTTELGNGVHFNFTIKQQSTFTTVTAMTTTHRNAPI